MKVKLRRLLSKVWFKLGIRRNGSLSSFPDLVFPENFTRESLQEWLGGFCLEDTPEHAHRELRNYLAQDYVRFVHTYNLVVGTGIVDGKVLEIGANPYYTSLLLERFTRNHVDYINYFGESYPVSGIQTMVSKETGEQYRFEFSSVNVDNQEIAVSGQYDTVLFCEVIEHLFDPLHALLEIKKALKKNGYLIISTPNVNRLINVARMIQGSNIYDPYSGYGTYGRHNREYNKDELFRLLNHAGFSIESLESVDVHPENVGQFCSHSRLKKVLSGPRRHDLGQYLFCVCRNSDIRLPILKPDWLYRSYPPEEMEHPG